MTSDLQAAPSISRGRSFFGAEFQGFLLGTAFLLLVQLIQLIRPTDFGFSLNEGVTLDLLIVGWALGLVLLARFRPSLLSSLLWILPLPLLTAWSFWQGCLDPSLSGWLIGCLGTLLWTAWYVEVRILSSFPWTWPIWTFANLGLLGWLYLDGYYFQFTGSHLSLYQLILVGGVDLTGIPQLVGVSQATFFLLGRHILIFLLYSLTVAFCTYGSRIPHPRGAWKLPFAAAMMFLASWSQFDALIESRPIGAYLEWRIEMGLFPLPQPSRFSGPEMRRAMASHPPIVASPDASFTWRPGAEKYNIVLLLVESWRADHFEPLMPRSAAFARRGLLLRDLQSQANGTVFSLAGLYSGKHPIDFFRIYRGADTSPWLAFLKASGYRLTRFSWDFERHDSLDRQFDSRRFPGNDMAGHTKTMLEETLKTLEQPGPHLIEAYLYNTHFAYYFPEEFARFTPVADANLPLLSIAPTEEIRLGLQNRYKNSILYLDSLLGNFFDRAQAAGIAQKTIFVVVGDHGESLGEDAGFGHCSGPHLSQFRIPGFILAPGIAPQEITVPTQHLDLIPTIAALGGFIASGLPGLDVREIAKNGRQALLQADTSTANRLILRRADRMSLFQTDARGQVHWIITTRNDFTLDPPLLALYEKSGIASLAPIIEADRDLLLRQLSLPHRPSGQ